MTKQRKILLIECDNNLIRPDLMTDLEDTPLEELEAAGEIFDKLQRELKSIPGISKLYEEEGLTCFVFEK